MRMQLLTAISLLLIMASSTLYADKPELANYTYATYLGTGFYKAAGRDVTVINLGFSYTPPQQSGRYLYRWRLPVSMGFYDVKNIHNVDDQFATLSWTPGIEWEIPYNNNTTLVPYVDLGWAKNMASGDNAITYSTGLSSLHRFSAQNREQLWVNRVVYAGYKAQSTPHNHYVSLQTGIDWRTPFSFTTDKRRFYTTVFSSLFWYVNSVEFVRMADDESLTENINASIEVGFTLGLEKSLDLHFFSLKQFGLGYRHGNGLEAIRLVFNQPI